MNSIRVLPAGTTKASGFAADYLRRLGIRICRTAAEAPSHILLDAPAFRSDGMLRNGEHPRSILSAANGDCIVCGGNLEHPELTAFHTIDFLSDAQYLSDNACITAEAALDVALPYLDITLRRCPVLIIGWGRIGKCLGQLLKSIGADVTIAARKETDRAMLHALGVRAVDISALESELPHFRLIYNTVPHMVLDEARMLRCDPRCVKLDLASAPGIAGEDVIIARGLPAIHFPESSGKLIAETFLRLVLGGTV